LKGELVGFDIDKDAVKLGKKSDSSIHFLVADIQKMPFKSHTFDVVVCNAVINFLKKQVAHNAVGEFRHVLKPEGFLYLYGLFIKNNLLTGILNLLSSIFGKVLSDKEASISTL
jgi:ubiquinone/menaquinone biosynthesis C-methylase UbiE